MNHNIFNNIIVGCPNGGGLFVINDGKFTQLDNLDTTGTSINQNIVVRGIQPDNLMIYYDNDYVSKTSDSYDDIHDVLLVENDIYLVSTTNNSVLRLNGEGIIQESWIFSKERDSWHLNCLATIGGRIVFTAFGDFCEHRGYKGKTHCSGFVQDLRTGERLITGLSQPHSIVPIGSNILLANSETNEILEYSQDFKLVRTAKLDGYPRGICVSGDVVFIGISCSRSDNEENQKSAVLVAIDKYTFLEICRIELPVREIYSIQTLNKNYSQFSSFVAEYSLKCYVDNIKTMKTQILKLNEAIAEHVLINDEIRKAYDCQLKDYNTQVQKLNEAIAEHVSINNYIKKTYDYQLEHHKNMLMQLNESIDRHVSNEIDLNDKIVSLEKSIPVRIAKCIGTLFKK